jgi:radical SAM superfamily enzyme YgiQ (UPF0313 family)
MSHFKRQIKILYVNAIDATNPLERSSTPLAFGYLTSAVRAKVGADTCVFRVVDSKVEETISEWEPDLVAISAVSQNYGYALKAAGAARKHNIPVVIGGIHVSMLPESLDPTMTVAVMGEGEETFAELVTLFLDGGRLGVPEALRTVRGIAYWNEGRLFQTEPRPLISPLDRIDHPARDVSPPGEDAFLISSRGCPYRCVFCCSSRYWGPVRLFSADYVLEEMRSLIQQYGVKRLIFFDDLFIWDKERLRQIVERFESDPLFCNVSVGCTIRAELVDEELAQLLKRLRVYGVGAGLESGSERILQYLKGPKASTEQNRRAVQLLHEHGIYTEASFILGSPGETVEDASQTVQFIKRVPLNDFGVHVLTPFPGTPLWDEAARKGIVSTNMDWAKLKPDMLDESKRDLLLAERMSYEEVQRFFDEINALKLANKRRLRRRAIVRKLLRQPRRFAMRLVRGISAKQ